MIRSQPLILVTVHLFLNSQKKKMAGATNSACGLNDNDISDLNTQLVTNVSLLIVLIGIPANILALIILKRGIIGKTTRFLLIVLSIEDTLLLLLYSVYYVANHYSEVYNFSALTIIRHADSLLLFLLNWTKMTEIYTIVIVSVDRYIAIRFPLQATRLCSIGNVKRALFVIIAIAFLFKLPNLVIGYKLAALNNCSIYVTYEVFAELPWFRTFEIVYVNLLDQVVSYVVPLGTILVLNVCLIRHVRQAYRTRRSLSNMVRNIGTISAQQSQANQRSLTITLVSVITVFILCETPTSMVFIISVYNIVSDHPNWTIIATIYPFALVLMLINCSINFVIYMLAGKTFRRMFIKVVCGSCLRSRMNHTSRALYTAELTSLRRGMKEEQTNQTYIEGRSLQTSRDYSYKG